MRFSILNHSSIHSLRAAESHKIPYSHRMESLSEDSSKASLNSNLTNSHFSLTSEVSQLMDHFAFHITVLF